MDYKSLHRKNFIAERVIPMSAIVPGAIITFNYVNEDKEFTKQMVLVLNERWKNNLHGLALEFITPKTLQEITTMVRLWYSRKLNEATKLRLPLLKVNVGNPKTFYHAIFKRIIEVKLKKVDCYREFVVNRMTNIKVTDYAYLLQEQIDKEAAENAEKKKVLLTKKKGI